ncbi:MAG: S41 family peptidase [Ignavibacteriales bacterium]|nr:S41 family peptidase [Ignavibacteriales bacterium]
MNKKIISFSLIAILLFSGFITRDNDLYFGINKGIDLFGRVYKEVTLNYVYEINPREFVVAGIEGMLQSLDPYSNYIDANEQKDLDLITKGKYGGIGASVGLRNDEVTILDLLEGYPAKRQGMRIGDVIKKINDIEINKDNYEQLGNILKGDIGTSVKLNIKRENEELIFNLIREEIEVKNISFYGFVPENSNNAYIKLTGFSHSAGEELKKALLELKEKNAIKTLVIDLRGNPGGLLDAAIDVCEKFLKKGDLIVTVKGRDSLSVKKYFSKEEPILSNEKIIVLIDEHTASAAEIVAGALQDHDRAVVVGENSFGKGLVQTIISLPYGTSLKLTTAKYYTPSGRCIQKIDYSKNNKVFSSNSFSNQKEYFTDNKRKVFSSGGITPDSIISNNSISGLVERLKAEGMFFRFATNYFNINYKIDLEKLDSNQLMKEFTNYLSKQNYSYTSKSLKIINQLDESLNTEKLNDAKIQNELAQLKAELEKKSGIEIQAFKDDIINEIKEELAARILGREGRIIQSLKNDKQFRKAYEILSNEKVYMALLKSYN